MHVGTQPRVGDRVAGRYRLDERIGAGGTGVVWRATDVLLDRGVALKRVLVPSGAVDAEIVHEARVAARLHHSCAVTVFDIVAEGDDRWLVQEYVAGRSLDRILAEDGVLLRPVSCSPRSSRRPAWCRRRSGNPRRCTRSRPSCRARQRRADGVAVR